MCMGGGDSYRHRAASLDICLKVHGEQKSLSDFREVFQFCVVLLNVASVSQVRDFLEEDRTVLCFGWPQGPISQ